LFAGDGRRSVYDKKPQRYAEDIITERADKSETEVSNNETLRSRYCTVKADGHKASRDLTATA